MRIKMPRGDIRYIRFTITDNTGEIVKIDFDEIYFTVKRNFKERKALIQKRWSEGDITRDDNGYYYFSIQPEDTDGLDYGKHVFDIEIVLGTAIKQTTIGDFVLTEEVTYASNEGAVSVSDSMLGNVYSGTDALSEGETLNITLTDYIIKFAYDYNELANKPQINSVELVGNRSLEDLDIQHKGSYADEALSNAEIEELLN